MHVWIDQRNCVGNGICEELCPELFEYDGNLAYARASNGARLPNGQAGLAPVAEDLVAAVIEAAAECPAACIHVLD